MSKNSINVTLYCEPKTFTDPDTGEKRPYNDIYLLAYNGKVKIKLKPYDQTAKDVLLSLYD